MSILSLIRAPFSWLNRQIQNFACYLVFHSPIKSLWWYIVYSVISFGSIQPYTTMNWGYAKLDNHTSKPLPQPVDEDLAHTNEKYQFQLYRYVATFLGDNLFKQAEERAAKSDGKDGGVILAEIGCGRGGGSQHLARVFPHCSFIGIDFAPGNIALCKKSAAEGKLNNVTYLVGSADNMPLPSSSVDVILNVESSHCYPDFAKFLQESSRVLKKGGLFLHCDLRDSREAARAWEAELKASEKHGMIVKREEDITKNVLASRDMCELYRNVLKQTAGNSWFCYAYWVNWMFRGSLEAFCGLPGTHAYEMMKKGECVYRAYGLVKE